MQTSLFLYILDYKVNIIGIFRLVYFNYCEVQPDLSSQLSLSLLLQNARWFENIMKKIKLN